MPQARPAGPRPVVVEELGSRPLENVPLTPIEELREQIGGHLADHDLGAATGTYLRLLELDPHQVLGRGQQIEIANYLAHTRRYEEAARAYEAFLEAYPGAVDLGQVQLFLGLIYSRYLRQYDRAVTHLRQALQSLQTGRTTHAGRGRAARGGGAADGPRLRSAWTSPS